MPYRRLPNTDKARLRALDHNSEMLTRKGPQNVPYSENSINKIRTIFPKFKNAVLNLEAARKNQAKRNKEYIEMHRKARMYVSHYIQVMNFAISRGELKADIRKFYGTEEFENNLPPLSTDEAVLEWGKRIIEGDQKRVMNGGNPLYNPSIALVKVNYEKFSDAFHFQKNLVATSERGSTLVHELRAEIDSLILQLWNEIEEHYEKFPDAVKRSKAQKHGLVYVLRKNEKAKLDAKSIQPELNF